MLNDVLCSFLYSRMLSKYITIIFPIKSLKIQLITCIKVVGALERRIDMTIHLNQPSLIMQVAFHSSPNAFYICHLVMNMEMILVKIVAP